MKEAFSLADGRAQAAPAGVLPEHHLSELCASWVCVLGASASRVGPCAGPVTILNWSFPRKDLSRSAQAYQLALALREEVDDLQKAGCRVIQVTLFLAWPALANQMAPCVAALDT